MIFSDKVMNYLESTGLGFIAEIKDGGEMILFHNSDGWEDFVHEFPDFEGNDVDLGYAEEYMICNDCGKYVETDANLNADGEWIDGFFFCVDCIDKELFIEDIINDFKRANKLLTKEELKENGFTTDDLTYEIGLHEHQNDDPEEIYKIYRDKHDEVIMHLENTTPFTVTYSVWGR